ncbi:hypothetical protein D3C74_266930 [compost metagenome]
MAGRPPAASHFRRRSSGSMPSRSQSTGTARMPRRRISSSASGAAGVSTSTVPPPGTNARSSRSSAPSALSASIHCCGSLLMPSASSYAEANQSSSVRIPLRSAGSPSCPLLSTLYSRSRRAPTPFPCGPASEIRFPSRNRSSISRAKAGGSRRFNISRPVSTSTPRFHLV